MRKGRASLSAPQPSSSARRSDSHRAGNALSVPNGLQCAPTVAVPPRRRSLRPCVSDIVLVDVDIAGNEKYVCQQTSVEAETMRGI